MSGVYINARILDFNHNYNCLVSTYQPLKNFNVNSQEKFIFYCAKDGDRLLPIPCYKTNRVTADGERVYYPAMSLHDVKAFKSLRNKPFLTREDKAIMARVSEALDKCAESYGLSSGSIPINRLSDYYEHYEHNQRIQEMDAIENLRKASKASI